MIEGIYEIGKLNLKDENDSLTSLIKNIPTQKSEKKQYLLCLDFKTNYKDFKFDIKEIDDNTKNEYIYIGNPKAANDPQDRLTTTRLDYLISQTIPNLINSLNECELKNILDNILDNYYIDLGNLSGQQKRYKYIIDLNKIGIDSEDSNAIINEIKKDNQNDYVKKVIQKFCTIIFDHIKSQKNISQKDIGLFSILYNNKILADTTDYKNYLKNKITSSKQEDNIKKICFMCDSIKDVTFDTTKLRFTYYITDKIGFSSELNGKSTTGFLRNFALCDTCLKRLLAGENFILNNFKFRINYLDMLLIPKFIFKTSIDLERIKIWGNSINEGFNKKLDLESLRLLEDKLHKTITFEDSYNNIIINLLFYKKDQSAFKILKLIKDIPPSGMINIFKTIAKNNEYFKEIINIDNIELRFEETGYLISIVNEKSKTIDFKKILNFYDSIFSNKPISYEFLINQFTNVAASKMLNSQTKTFGDKSKNLAIYIQKCLILLNILKNLNLVNMGGPMSYENLNINKKIIDYVEKLNLNPSQTGLFLLGYLIGEIGNAQYKKGNKSKPILEKINYRGMDKNKIIRLCNEIFEKLKETKIIEYHEKDYAEMKNLIDNNIKNWNLNDSENVFYVLSGYSYSTLLMISSKNNNINLEEN
ncbi:MAG: TIGR02556 family CRISPR-associated protein [Cyanobacteria bacterium]|nr:TIGR02556 family CRISPR-associated protein [Cyanobacteriota bacterium]